MVVDSRSAPSPEVIEVRVPELRRLFNAIDPSPFHERELDPAAEEFIVDWAGEAPRSRPLALRVHVDRRDEGFGDSDAVAEAIRQFFGRREATTRRRLRELFRRGRISLLIGLGFLGASSLLANMLTGPAGAGGVANVLRDSIVIGGWVAMWRPLEVFLYDWWPIRAEAGRYARLAAIPVSIVYANA